MPAWEGSLMGPDGAYAESAGAMVAREIINPSYAGMTRIRFEGFRSRPFGQDPGSQATPASPGFLGNIA